MQIQRKRTDRSIKNLKEYLKEYQNASKSDLSKNLKLILTDIGHIVYLRKKIDDLSIDDEYAMNFYSDFNEKILSLILEISKLSSDSLITQNIIAYSNFLYSKEYAGLE